MRYLHSFHGSCRGISHLCFQRYIYERDAVREILMGLQGRRNMMFSWTNVGDEPYIFTVCLTSSSLSSYSHDSQIACVRCTSSATFDSICSGFHTSLLCQYRNGGGTSQEIHRCHLQHITSRTCIAHFLCQACSPAIPRNPYSGSLC